MAPPPPGAAAWHGLALLQSARLAALEARPNEAKSLLARALELGAPAAEVHGLDLMLPEFPISHGAPTDATGASQVAVSEDGLVMGFVNGGRLLAWTRGAERARDLGPVDDYGEITLSPTGRYLSFATNLGRLTLHDVGGARVLFERELFPGPDEPRGLTTAEVAFAPDESELLYAYEYADPGVASSRRVVVVPLEGSDPERELTLSGHGRIAALAYTPDGRRLVSGERNSVKLRDLGTGEVLRELDGSGSMYGLAFSSDGRWLAVGGSQEVRVHELASGRRVTAFRACTHNVVELAFLADDRFLAYRSPRGESGVFSVPAGERVARFPIGRDGAIDATHLEILTPRGWIDLSDLSWLGPVDPELATRTSPRHERRRARSAQGTAALPAAVETVRSALPHDHPSRRDYFTAIRGSIASPSGKRAAYWTENGHTIVHEPGSDRTWVDRSERLWSTRSAAFLSGDRRLLRAAASNNGQGGGVELIDLDAGERVDLRLPDPPAALALAPGEGHAALLDGAGRLWLIELPEHDDALALREPVRLLAPIDGRREVSFSDDGRWLVVTTDGERRAYPYHRYGRDPLPAPEAYGLRVRDLDVEATR